MPALHQGAHRLQAGEEREISKRHNVEFPVIERRIRCDDESPAKVSRVSHDHHHVGTLRARTAVQNALEPKARVGLHFKKSAIQVEEFSPKPLHSERTLKDRDVETKPRDIQEMPVLHLPHIHRPSFAGGDDLGALPKVVLRYIEAAGEIAAGPARDEAQGDGLPGFNDRVSDIRRRSIASDGHDTIETVRDGSAGEALLVAWTGGEPKLGALIPEDVADLRLQPATSAFAGVRIEDDEGSRH